MIDVILGAISGYTPEQIKPYVESLNNINYTGHKVMITYNVSNDTQKYLWDNGFMVATSKIPLGQHIHMRRLLDFYSYLKYSEFDYRFVVATDVRDVMFQKNPMRWLETNLNKDILISSECVLNKDEPWAHKNIHEGYGDIFWKEVYDKLVYNVGVIAGKKEAIQNLFLLNYLVSQAGNTEHFTDQSAFNYIINMDLIKDKLQLSIGDDWAIQCGTLDNPNNLANIKLNKKNGLYYNDNELVTIIHQYDRLK
jgi:hypothetical protein